jgi:hypothetical protein
MKFIRKHGRVIPIRDPKAETAKKVAKVAAKTATKVVPGGDKAALSMRAAKEIAGGSKRESPKMKALRAAAKVSVGTGLAGLYAGFLAEPLAHGLEGVAKASFSKVRDLNAAARISHQFGPGHDKTGVFKALALRSKAFDQVGSTARRLGTRLNMPGMGTKLMIGGASVMAAGYGMAAAHRYLTMKKGKK